MYKLLLSWRYLRTRYIALASIISVTLGVATLIVVNSVMAGFSAEMHKRLHSILSDIVIESAGLQGIFDPEQHMQEIKKIVGDDLAEITAIVRVPAMLHFQYRGHTITQQVMLIGIDEQSYPRVSDFKQYLLHPENQEALSFQLRNGGYDQRLPQAGWNHRRSQFMFDQAYAEEIRRVREAELRLPASATPHTDANQLSTENGPFFAPLPEKPPVISVDEPKSVTQPPADSEANALDQRNSSGVPPTESDPFLSGGSNRRDDDSYQPFDPINEQYTGVILGIAIVSTKVQNPKTKQAEDRFFCLPGDDVQITLPSTGMPPKPISGSFTVVDFYESKMSEYDSSFAFMPLRKLQELRSMIDPLSGIPSVTSIQLKLRPEADLNKVRDKLREHFPPPRFPYRIQTWRDMQGPLLAAVRLETTILNILLFLIIAVAGFGILATFFMIVVEKTRDIGILKALGAPSRGVMSIFLTYGVSLGVVGSGAGIVLGLLFVVYINDIATIVEMISGQKVFDETIYYFQQIPTIINPITVAWVAAGAVLIAVIASVMPAVRAAKMHPVEALRYE